MIPLVPELPRLLSTSPSNASWIVTTTLLAGAVFTPISGRLGDIFGKKSVALVLLGAILVGSLLAAVTTTLIPMVVGRAFQGAGLGMIPLGIGMLRDTIPPERLGRSVALMAPHWEWVRPWECRCRRSLHSITTGTCCSGCRERSASSVRVRCG
ncbi:MFS transporter [Rhodococcus sp. USK10]|uniref:MFS transporter n=1 Tax=Rhodococcus sp. USK10 TaxID=2789739 RepID=UPI0021516820|nr:MFS transporter [Rhodococcus sp. USK10]